MPAKIQTQAGILGVHVDEVEATTWVVKRLQQLRTLDGRVRPALAVRVGLG